MGKIRDGLKRAVLGTPISSDKLGHTLLPKRLALPVFASDALSSVAYAPDEILLTLSLAGVAAVTMTPWVGLAVVIVLVTVVMSYRQNVHAYPSGGGDYEVASKNLGGNAGLGVASALLVDYMLTVAVSVSSGAQYLTSAAPALHGYEVWIAVSVITFLALMNLRGVKESGRAFAIPVYIYMGAVGLMLMVGVYKAWAQTLPMAQSASLTMIEAPGYDAGLTGLAGGFLLLRAFSSGCAALTGVEAISNGVPAFRKPKSANAASTLALLGAIAAVMLMSVLYLAGKTGVKYVEEPAHQLLDARGVSVGEAYQQNPVIGQLADAVFRTTPILFILVTVVTGLILVLAANTAFNGFPVLGSILARDGYLPRQLDTRGDRLAYSNGIIVLAVSAIILVIGFDAQVTRLIQLYIVGVFISFTVSQLGMVRHWSRKIRLERGASERRAMVRSRYINAFGFLLTGTVLVIVLITKFTRGAWITLLIMAIVYLIMNGINRHYRAVADQLALGDIDSGRFLPSRVHAVVLVSSLNWPTLRAISFARATVPSTLTAVTVAASAEQTEAFMDKWRAEELDLSLVVLDSPYREVVRPIIEYVQSIRRQSPRDLVVVYVPEYVVSKWWEQILHNQTALRLKSRMLFLPGVVMASVPFQLGEGGSVSQLPKRKLRYSGPWLKWSQRPEGRKGGGPDEGPAN